MNALAADNLISAQDESQFDPDKNFVVPKAYAVTQIQDPLYPNYKYEYMPSSDGQNFRIRAKLEKPSNNFIGITGYFYYYDEKTGQYACDPTLNYFCMGPAESFLPFDPGKPVIYLYPTHKEKIDVIVRPKEITESIPQYNGKWEVIADPDGTIYNLDDGKFYPYLFWEGKSNKPIIDKNTGFVVKNEEVESFLNEKLAKLGLNQKESSDYIEYWAPRMKKGPFVYIYFMPQAIYDRLIPIEITPKPDTVIRVYTLFKSLEQPIIVQEQKLTSTERKGFTVIEWGGDRSEIK